MFNNTSKELPYVIAGIRFPGVPRPGVKPVGGVNKEELHLGPVTYNYEFLNFFGRAITVVDRNGFRHTVPARVDHQYRQSFVIRMRISFAQEAWAQMDSLLAGLPANKYEILHACKEHWENLRHSTPMAHYGRPSTKTIILDFVVEPSMLFDKESIYVRQADLVVSTLDILQAPPHPMHPDAANVQKLQNQNDDVNKETSIQYELIEEEKTLSCRYVMVSGKIFTIVPKKDNRRQEGLYITYINKDAADHTKFYQTQERYGLEELENLGLYKTAEDAQTAGDLKTARREELARLEHDTLKAKRDLEVLKFEQEGKEQQQQEKLRQVEHARKIEVLDLNTKILDLERSNRVAAELAERERTYAAQETARIKEEFERKIAEANERAARAKADAEERTQYRKDYYEERAHSRKDHYDERSKERTDSSEIVKFLPAIVLGIGALVIAGLKLLSSK